MNNNDKDRQQRWRDRQTEQGMVQVRLWVPEDCADEVRAIAIAMRLDEVARDSTKKQRYEARRSAYQWGVPKPEPEIYFDFRRLEIWLALHPRAENSAR